MGLAPNKWSARKSTTYPGCITLVVHQGNNRGKYLVASHGAWYEILNCDPHEKKMFESLNAMAHYLLAFE